MARGLLACFGSKGGSRKSHEKPAAGATAHVSAEEQQRSGPVLVELFSSQGCSTSPVAELLVSRLGRGDFDGTDLPPVVVLAFHVDYWDYMGWKDPYGSSQWTVRQKAYVEALGLDTMFTPQIVLQGNIPKAIAGLPASIPNRFIEVKGGQLRCQCDGGAVRERADHRLPQGREPRTCPVQRLRRPTTRKALHCQRHCCKEDHFRNHQLLLVGRFQSSQM